MLCNSRTHSLRVLTTALVSICCLVQGEITQAEDDWTHSCARVLYTHNLPKSKNPWKKGLLMSVYKCGDCSWKVTCPGNRQYQLWNSNPKQPSHLCSFHYVIQLFFSLSLFSESCLNQKEMKLGYINFLISLFCTRQSYSIDQVTSVEQLTRLQTVH